MNKDVSKKIWIFWEQGFENAPPVCKMCLNSWIAKNKSWEVIVLDKSNLKNYVDVFEINKDFFNIRPIQTRSDLIRTLLLKKHGGVWVDATLYCYKPLDLWLPQHDFFTFTYPNYGFSSWFISSTTNNHIIKTFSKKYFSYFEKHLVAKNYFQFHHTFHEILEKDNVFKDQYENIKILDARKARILKYNRHKISNKNFSPIFLKNLNSPVLKLSHKINKKDINCMKNLFEHLENNIKIKHIL